MSVSESSSQSDASSTTGSISSTPPTADQVELPILPSPDKRDGVESVAPHRLDLSVRLRQATAAAHNNVRRPTLVAHLEAGTLPPSIYLAYLRCLHTIYSALEVALARHPSHPYLCTTHHPALLARATALEADCRWYEAMGVVSSGGGEAAAEQYAARLKELGDSEEEEKIGWLLAHSYVRYLGDLSGGRVIVRTVSKAYNLHLHGGGGSTFYDFQPLSAFPPSTFYSSALPALSPSVAVSTATDSSTRTFEAATTPSEIKSLVAWFRTSLNEVGAQMTDHEQRLVVLEASLAFELNRTMFLEFESIFDARGERSGEREIDADWKLVASRREGVGALVDSLEPLGEDHGTMSWSVGVGMAVAVGLAICIGARDRGYIAA